MVIVAVVSYELLLMTQRIHLRRSGYQKALDLSKKTGKKLLVIGDPHAGSASRIITSYYGCGDKCLDLHGCPKCTKSIEGRMEDWLPKFEDNSYVIFCSCVLTYVDDPYQSVSEMHRVSGGDMVVVHVQPFSLIHWYYTGSKWRIWSVDEENGTVKANKTRPFVSLFGKDDGQ